MRLFNALGNNLSTINVRTKYKGYEFSTTVVENPADRNLRSQRSVR